MESDAGGFVWSRASLMSSTFGFPSSVSVSSTVVLCERGVQLCPPSSRAFQAFVNRTVTDVRCTVVPHCE